ncbi:MAG: hypothetical protein HUU01_05205 [Saprospiraceae bacterium]|nr:hypothetical protein [Saprospiraceae bacterium]
MKKIIQLSLLAVVLVLAAQDQAFAQKKKKSDKDNAEYFDESGSFMTRVWFGGGFTLGFAGNNFESLFQVGISPMAGYKITDNFSIGPRLSLQYESYRIDTGNGIAKANPLIFGGGVFTRYKFIPALFAHVEYELASDVRYIYGGGTNLETLRIQRNNLYLGLGYTSTGSLLGYEISLLYNVNADENTLQQPFDIRFGLNYNF